MGIAMGVPQFLRMSDNQLTTDQAARRRRSRSMISVASLM
jgi:hypothetical protein